MYCGSCRELRRDECYLHDGLCVSRFIGIRPTTRTPPITMISRILPHGGWPLAHVWSPLQYIGPCLTACLLRFRQGWSVASCPVTCEKVAQRFRKLKTKVGSVILRKSYLRGYLLCSSDARVDATKHPQQHRQHKFSTSYCPDNSNKLIHILKRKGEDATIHANKHRLTNKRAASRVTSSFTIFTSWRARKPAAPLLNVKDLYSLTLMVSLFDIGFGDCSSGNCGRGDCCMFHMACNVCTVPHCCSVLLSV